MASEASRERTREWAAMPQWAEEKASMPLLRDFPRLSAMKRLFAGYYQG